MKLAPNHQPFAHSVLLQLARKMVEVPDNITVKIQIECGTAQLCVDVDQIERALINLILNAVQAMPDGGRLTLRSHCPNPNQIEIEVCDTGSGIALEDRDRIFEPLFSRKVKGIGFGLSLSRRYAQLSNGTLTFDSEFGRGTTFRLTLPRANTE